MNRRSLIKCGGAAALAAMALPGVSQAASICYPNGICEVGIPNIGMTPAQECPEWCWAASIQAVFGLHGRIISDQSVIVAKIFGGPVCQPATNQQMFYAINGLWRDDYGNSFQAQTTVLYDPTVGIQYPNSLAILLNELAMGNPLINGAIGHATVVTAARFFNSPMGPQLQSVTIRDPWPDNPNRRTLSQQEIMGTSFIAMVRVS